MAEPCVQCGHRLADSSCGFYDGLRNMGGISYGLTKEYCIDCWHEWFNGRHHHDQHVQLEITDEQNGCLSVSCCDLSGAPILTKDGVSKCPTIEALRKWLEEGNIELRQDRDGRLYTLDEHIKWHWNDKWLRDESEDARKKHLINQWKMCTQLKKSFNLVLPNARLLPSVMDSEPLGNLVSETAVFVCDTVVYVGEPRQIPGGLVLQTGK